MKKLLAASVFLLMSGVIPWANAGPPTIRPSDQKLIFDEEWLVLPGYGTVSLLMFLAPALIGI